MPVNFWEIHSHTVFLHQDGPSDVHSQRKLTLTNASASIRAVISFRAGGGLGSVNLLNPPGKLRENVEAVWPLDRFTEAYGVLRGEGPVFLGYSWAPPDAEPDARYGDLLQIAITTADRPWWE
jgi:hypothetical protein